MIFEASLEPFFKLIEFILDFIPLVPSQYFPFSDLILFLRKGLYFTDVGMFNIAITTVVTFTTLQFAWAIFEWVYKKIPGIN